MIRFCGIFLKTLENCGVALLVFLCRFWQVLLSPLAGNRCRFYPTCSEYAVLSLKQHGLIRGGWLALHRICRCHPFAHGGVDAVPPERSRKIGF